MRSKRVIVLMGMILIIVLTVVVYGINQKDNNNYISLINHIKYSYKNGTIINLDNLNLKKEITIDNSSNFTLPEEYLALGYNLIYDKDKRGIDYLNKAFDLMDKKTDFYVKYLTIQLLRNNLADLNEESRYILEGIKKFDEKDHELHFLEIRELLVEGPDTDEGRKVLIDSINYILNNKKVSSEAAISSYRNILGMHYIMQGKYSEGIENYLEIIYLGNSMDDKYYMNKALIDLGTVYGMLNQYEEAEEIYEQAYDINLPNMEDDNYMKLYYYANIIECLINQRKYDEFFDKCDEMDRFIEKEYKDGYRNQSFILQLNIYKLKAYLELGEVDKADDIINTFDDLESQMMENYFIDSDMAYFVILGDYYYKKGDYKKAIQLYKRVYDCEKTRMNKNAKEEVLHKLVWYYQSTGDYKKSSFYSNQLIEFNRDESSFINSGYIKYIIDKYEYEKELILASEELLKNSMERGILAVVFISSISVGIIVIFMLKKNNRIDGLTHMYNRKYFDKEFDGVLKKQYKNFIHDKPSYLCMYDIDNFKNINDTYGHDFGDEVIKAIAAVSKKEIKHKGKAFRYGGEEFILIIKNINEEEVLQIAENIRQAVENLSFRNQYKVTISIGLTVVEENKEVTFKKVDEKLYISKKTGKNRITS
ncbi:GGDEF domain-containing protein [Clostridium butyricum]|uniref:diguanylate cyclase n=1 Tax=Clostridium butyricum TaxID=1492 RepID=UPI001BA9EA87|nr:diguanylate cyclase [Clostridium butyricum]QUF84809.1 GGDEF domain-containing protein [Clostridium butyricum]